MQSSGTREPIGRRPTHTLGESTMIEAIEYLRIRLSAVKGDRGASAVEYGLLVALIAIIIIVAVSLLGTNLSGIFNKTATSIGSGGS